MSPQNFGKFHGVQAMGPVKEDKSIRVKSELVSSYNNKLDSIKEEGLNLNSASFNNLNSTTVTGTGMGTNIDIKKEESGGKKDGMKKEENGGGGGVFHEKQLLQGSNTDQLDVKNLPVSQHDKLQTSPNWNNKQTDGHMVMNRENNRIDGPQFPHMPMQYPQHYHGPNQAHQPSHVFSTLLANQAAKAVYTGQANSIITFHQTLTANRKFLDPEQDIKVDPANNQPPASTPTPPRQTGGLQYHRWQPDTGQPSSCTKDRRRREPQAYQQRCRKCRHTVE
ncbi:putative collagen alpha-5(IV) chain-like isoform X1 [Apostichopus japonicus]|uniref:Putative collagen alpha-5(IV) chain-like isoform X1 n=1 Tax=Stichopus japonicus TaxID=307972 RepID=A0A2G8JQ36_STIJA|nr:putative collagen alpha-5(IV) chain-like isoform X1 [Apostichopus japonicus]